MPKTTRGGRGKSTTPQGDQKVGKLSARVISLLGLSQKQDQPILLGASNITHMQARHPADYQKYGKYIPQILAKPDYVRLNNKDGSIEYVKDFQINGEFVKVAVRTSGGGKLYARSIYVLTPQRVKNFIKSGALKKV